MRGRKAEIIEGIIQYDFDKLSKTAFIQNSVNVINGGYYESATDFSGEGAAMPGGIIEELTLTFDTNNKLSKEQLRKLLIECAKELVAQVKMNNNIEQFLAKSPFSIENVQIRSYSLARL